MRRAPLRALVAAATLATVTTVAGPAEAITDGQLDNGAHPQVGLMVAQDEDGTPLWRCSGTLVSPTDFITAGHCTSDDAGGSVAGAEVFFGDHYDTNPEFTAALQAGDPTPCLHGDETSSKKDDYRLSGYPCTGDVSGTPYTHPDYDPSRFWVYDLGVVVLDEPWALPDGHEYASLPEPGQFDSWTSSTKQVFTAVGYGLQEAYGAGANKDVANKTRMYSTPELYSVNTPSTGDFNLILSNNTSTGGTCSGDSGGPNFLGDSLVIAGVTSWGNNANSCGGRSGVYRLDREEDRAWLASVMDSL